MLDRPQAPSKPLSSQSLGGKFARYGRVTPFAASVKRGLYSGRPEPRNWLPRGSLGLDRDAWTRWYEADLAPNQLCAFNRRLSEDVLS
jgi:hypothetical protein